MIKPEKLQKGDVVATISPSWGCAGDADARWKYDLGVARLKELGLNVVAAPNSMKGDEYLQDNPEARAEDLMWAFENKQVKGIIANIGGNDSERILPFLSTDSIINNPKILCGYSDVMTLHLFCGQLGLMTFYGDNLMTTIAEAEQWHPYSKYWFEKCLCDSSIVGEIAPSADWSPDANNHTDKSYVKKYIPNGGYQRIQGHGVVRGDLFGGHGGLMDYAADSLIKIQRSCFENKILFFEDIPEMCDVDYVETYFEWLAENGFLQALNGIIIGKIQSYEAFEPYAEKIVEIVSDRYGLVRLPIMYGLNFGHSNPICILPYGAEAELDVDNLKFSIVESCVK